jgi:hypothetical protein
LFHHCPFHCQNPWRGWSPRIFHWALVPHQNKWDGGPSNW